MGGDTVEVLGHTLARLMLDRIKAEPASWDTVNPGAKLAFDGEIPASVPREALALAEATVAGKAIAVAAFSDPDADYDAVWIADENGVVLFKYEN